MGPRTDPSGRPWAAILVGLVTVAVVGVALSEPSLSPPTSAAPLSAPDDPTGGTGQSAPSVSQPVDDWMLGLQSRSGVQWLDPLSGEPVAMVDGLFDAIGRGDEVFGRRPGELVVVRQDGGFEVFEVADQQFVDWVTPNPTMDLTPRPVALIPTVAGDGESVDRDLILARVAIDGSQWSDIPLPGCGFGYPIAAQSSDRVFAMWCGGSHDLRVFVDEAGDITEQRFTDLINDGASPSILERGDKPILIDAGGQIWTLVLSSQPSLGVTGDLDLDEGESHHGIAAISEDFRIAVVGVTRSDELPGFGGRVTAGRLVGFDLVRGRIIWDESSPTPIESLVAAPDGLVYGYRSDPDTSGGDLFAIDPATGEITVRASGLSSEPGRLFVTSPTNAVTSADRTSATEAKDEGPLFGVGIYTDALLLFDNGLDGILAVEPDERLAARSTLEGQRAGDEPYSMIRVGDSLVVGSSEIFAVDIATREPTSRAGHDLRSRSRTRPSLDDRLARRFDRSWDAHRLAGRNRRRAVDRRGHTRRRRVSLPRHPGRARRPIRRWNRTVGCSKSDCPPAARRQRVQPGTRRVRQ